MIQLAIPYTLADRLTVLVELHESAAEEFSQPDFADG